MELVLSDSGRVCMHLGTSVCDTLWSILVHANNNNCTDLCESRFRAPLFDYFRIGTCCVDLISSWCVQLWMRHTEFKNENESSSRMRTNSRTEEPGENARNWDKRRTLPSKYTKHKPCYCYIFGDHRPTSLSALAVRACRLPLRESWSTYVTLWSVKTS